MAPAPPVDPHQGGARRAPRCCLGPPPGPKDVAMVASSPPSPRIALFDYGFRPFFLLASLYAALAVPVWLLLMTGVITLPTGLAAMQWHGHEMVFGFAL